MSLRGRIILKATKASSGESYCSRVLPTSHWTSSRDLARACFSKSLPCTSRGSLSCYSSQPLSLISWELCLLARAVLSQIPSGRPSYENGPCNNDQALRPSSHTLPKHFIDVLQPFLRFTFLIYWRRGSLEQTTNGLPTGTQRYGGVVAPRLSSSTA